jgi:peptidoglycan hydrolase-like protein with peptidoglycan-binding domain
MPARQRNQSLRREGRAPRIANADVGGGVGNSATVDQLGLNGGQTEASKAENTQATAPAQASQAAEGTATDAGTQAPAGPTVDQVLAGTVLDTGATGPAVDYVQKRLNELGFATATSGVFDAATQRAVRLFQQGRSQVNGKVGPTTLGLLQTATAAKDFNAAIAAAAESYRGTSTAKGPDGGNLACAWAVNNILQQAIGRKIGANTNYVPSVLAGVKLVGQSIPQAEAKAGDIVIAPNTGHIGIYLGGGRVLSNSSSRAAFVWESGINFDGYYGGGTSTVWRITK